MERKQNEYVRLGFNALKRAAAKVANKARKENHKIPVWKDGQIEFIIPDSITEQVNKADGIAPLQD
jgi:hypothetical protein